jgi:putative glutamine amidotransferase
MPAEPHILITRAEAIPDERWDDYADRVAEAGGYPIEVQLERWLAGQRPPAHRGLIVTGGVDVEPARYGEPRSDRVQEVNPDRDRFEIALLEQARAAHRPVLAICRGHQLFNVARGGSLLQHLQQREPHRARRGPPRDGADGSIVSGWHDVEVPPGTALARAVGSGTLRVNSRHHQAVTEERVAPGLVVAATAPDGVVEALVDPSGSWAVSVQWHPEMPEVAESFRGLFTAFVSACAMGAGSDAGERARGRTSG